MKKAIILKLILLWTLSISGFQSAAGQVETPRPSLTASLTQEVGFGTVKIEYSRPHIRGRTIYGQLVPFGELWRTGANSSTKISFSQDVTLDGHAVPAGDYALFTIPGKEEWTIIIHKDTSFGGTGGYDEANDLVRFTAKPERTSELVKSFTIELADVTSKSAVIHLAWERTLVPIHLETDTDAQIIAQIEKFAKNPQASLFGSYARAAGYYLENGKNLDQALGWADKALEINPESLVVLHYKAGILAAMGDSEEAAEFARKSLAKSRKFNATGWVMKNEELLARIQR